MFKGPSRFLLRGEFVLELHLLRQVADSDVGLAGDSAAGGQLLTGDDAEHSGLAGTVLAHQCDFVTLVDDITDVLEQHLTAEFHFESLN